MTTMTDSSTFETDTRVEPAGDHLYRATLTDRVEQNEGTWSLVKENGEWKIDGWTVNNIDSRPA